MEVATTTGIRVRCGDSTAVSSGIAAPIAKVPADANAACTGRALSVSEIQALPARVSLMRRASSIGRLLGLRGLHQALASRKSQPAPHARGLDRS